MKKGRIKRWVGKFVIKSVIASVFTGGKAPWTTGGTPMNVVTEKEWDAIEPPEERKSPVLSGWKTMLLSAATIGLGVLESTHVTEWVSAHPGPWAIGIGVAIGAFRFVTKTPVFEKF